MKRRRRFKRQLYILPRQPKRTTQVRGWSRGAQIQAELSRVLAVSRTAWQQLKCDKHNIQLRREVNCVNKEVQRVGIAAKDRFLRRYVEELENDVPKQDQWGFVQHLKFLRIEDTRKVHSKNIREEEVPYCTTPTKLWGGGRGFQHPIDRECGQPRL